MPKSEAIKAGIIPPKNMTPLELDAWRESLDPDAMGFVGEECVDDGE